MEKAKRTVDLMGGRDKVLAAPNKAFQKGDSPMYPIQLTLR